MMSNDKLLRIAEYYNVSRENYSIEELFNDIEGSVFEELKSKTFSCDNFRRNLQRAYISQLINKITAPAPPPTIAPGSQFFAFTAPSVFKTDIKSIARMQLENLKAKLVKVSGADALHKAHLKDLTVIIEDALNPKK
jgi:hypothetical protein